MLSIAFKAGFISTALIMMVKLGANAANMGRVGDYAGFVHS